MSGRLRMVASAFLALVVFVAFHAALGHGFVNWDDDVYVYANETIRALTPAHVGWLFSHFYYYAFIPITLLSHAIDVAIWGLNPFGHHLTNLLLHVANSVWALFVGLALLGRMRARAGSKATSGTDPEGGSVAAVVAMTAATLLYAVHPLRVESVAWISDRKDLLCAFFLLPAFLAYLSYDARRGRRGAYGAYVLSLCLFLLAVLSKSYAVVFPVLLLLFDAVRPRATQEKRRLALRLLFEKVPFLAVSAAVTVASFAQSPNALLFPTIAGLTPLERALSSFHSLMAPVFKTIAPVGLSPLYPGPSRVGILMGAAAMLAITVACVLAARRGPRAPLLAWLAYLLLLTPNVGGLSSGMQPLADRYSYLATLGFFFLAGGAMDAWLRRGGWRYVSMVASAVALTAVLFALTQTQLSYWRSSRTLWSQVIETYPASPELSAAYINLAATLAEEGQLDEARAILNRSLGLDPRNAETLYNLGVVLYREDLLEEARGRFREAIALNPDHARANYYLAVTAARLGDDAEAVAAMIRAARLGDPDAQRALESQGIPRN